MRPVWLAVTGILAATEALAHHSATMFDGVRTVTITGTVKTFEWTNPHVWIWVEAPVDHGATAVWGIEAANLSMARRLGMDRDSFKVGDTVVMEINPLKDGRPGGRFRRATFSDGHVIDVTPPH